MFCRQRQDERLRRGGEQKSVVVLSEQPYSSALIPLAQYAGPLYFNIGQTALEEVTINVSLTPVTHCQQLHTFGCYLTAGYAVCVLLCLIPGEGPRHAQVA